jgi:hypothetical protein
MSTGVKDWTPNQLRLIAWLATPSDLREPRSQADLAAEMGVREETLSRWKRLDGLTGAAGELAREMVGRDLADIYGALVRAAKAGSFQHIKLALEVAEHYTEKREVSGPSGGPIQIVEVAGRGGNGDEKPDPADASWP